MINNDPNPNLPEFNRQAFKEAISMVESSGGKYLSNSTSSAAGKYHFLYRYLKDVPELKGITKGEFIRNDKLQEQVMDMALDGKLKGFTNYIEYAKKLKQNYGSNHTLEELAALTHFLGAGGARKQLASGNYKIPGKNATVDQYLGRFRQYYPGEMIVPSEPKQMVRDQTKIEDKAKDVIPEIAQPKRQIDKSLEFISQEPNSELQLLAQKEEAKVLQQQNDYLEKQKALESQNTMQQIEYHPAIGSEDTDVISWLNQNQNAFGGGIRLSNGGSIKYGDGGDLVEYANGGSHEQNSLGGIPIGNNEKGVMNTVEEGETQHGSYVFSDRIGINNLYKKK